MRHGKQTNPIDPEISLIAGRILVEEVRAAGMRSDLDRSMARIRRMKEQLIGLAVPGRVRRIVASGYIDGEGYVPILIEVRPGGAVDVTRVERMADVSWTDAAAAIAGGGAADIDAAHAATAWDPPLGDNGDLPPLTDEEVLAALRSVERDTDD